MNLKGKTPCSQSNGSQSLQMPGGRKINPFNGNKIKG